MLQKVKIAPGFNKQVTATGAEGQWVGGDYVRFRYGSPEKIGGWAQLGSITLTGRNTALHQFVNSSGIKYSALGTNRFLYIYSGGAFYDITPIKSTNTLTSAFTTTNGDATVTITFASSHNISQYDIIVCDAFTTITNSGFGSSDFNDKHFMVATVPSATTITVEMGSNESGSGASTSGGIRVRHFYKIGPAVEESAAGWGLGLWDGVILGAVTSTLNGAIDDDDTSLVLADSESFPSSGTVVINDERMTFTANNTGTDTLSGLTRGIDNTTAASHSDGATVKNATEYAKWGSSQTGDIVTAPGLWSLDNYGNKLIATISDGSTFEWDADVSTSTRAALISNAPTATQLTLVSTPDRHLIAFGTETTIGTTSTQDDMYIRWSSQETLTTWTPTSTNTAGTQRLADGTRIVGAIRGRDAIYIWTDTALFIMKFVGPPFTFSFQQVGTNCGLIGQHAAVEVDGSAYWMSENGFFRYTGKLESLPCLVEDYVYDDLADVPRQHIHAGLNNLFGEVTWFYPASGAASNNRTVTYNYMDSSTERPVWTTSSLARSTWADSAIFDKPHGTEYDSSATSDQTVGNTDGVTTYFEHETGTNQIKAGVTTAIAASIESGDYDISMSQGGGADIRGDGEYMMKIRRIIPDFLTQTGDARVTLNLKNYPTDSQASSSLGPFTTTTSTTKIDTRARARAISLKVDNTSVTQHWKLGTFRLDIQPDGRR